MMYDGERLFRCFGSSGSFEAFFTINAATGSRYFADSFERIKS